MIGMFKKNAPILVLLIFCPAMLYPVYAKTERTENKVPEAKEQYELGIEYVWPVHRDRQIHTTAVNILKRTGYYDNFLLTTYAGLTINYAWGHIIQEDPNNRETEYSNSAFGIGPLLHARWSPLSLDDLTFSIDANGGIIIHNRDFPAGGDLYNFIWRIGPSISYQIADKHTLIFGFRIMHVSNGQGLTRGNPAYDAAGISLHLSRFF